MLTNGRWCTYTQNSASRESNKFIASTDLTAKDEQYVGRVMIQNGAQLCHSYGYIHIY